MEELSVFGKIAATLGAPEAAFKLLLSLLIGYPLIYLHRRLMYRSDPTQQHLFFVVCGFALGVFNNGYDVIHSVVCVLTAWLSLVFIGPTQTAVVLANVFQMGYLIIGYWSTATETYDIKWTMPHCVLTLRLIALTWDYYDGHKDKSLLSKDQESSCLRSCPSLLEVAAHTYFPASYLVGPQFSMQRYLDFVHGRLFTEEVPDTVVLGLQRGALGLCFVAIYQVTSSYFPDTYLVSQEFAELSLASKACYLAVWGKITLYKYNSCWLVAEGVLIMSGLAFSGKDSTGKSTWTASRNVIVQLHETAYNFRLLVESFNINTNGWLVKYVFKRLKFMNNRNVSAISALMFLALWHGLHSGYYMCFLLEFFVNYFEKTITLLVGRYPKLTAQVNSPLVRPVLLVCMKGYVMVFFGYSLAPFVLLQTHRWMQFYASCYYVGHFIFGGVFLYAPLLKMGLDAVYGKPARKEPVLVKEVKETQEVKDVKAE